LSLEVPVIKFVAKLSEIMLSTFYFILFKINIREASAIAVQKNWTGYVARDFSARRSSATKLAYMISQQKLRNWDTGLVL
jgi:hypothetical protein